MPPLAHTAHMGDVPFFQKTLEWAAPRKNPLAKLPQIQVQYQVCNLLSSNICYKHTFTQGWLDPYRTGIVSFKHFVLKFLFWGQDRTAELLIHPPKFSSLCLGLRGTGGIPFTSPHFRAGCISPSGEDAQGGTCSAAPTALNEPQAGHCHCCHHSAPAQPWLSHFSLTSFLLLKIIPAPKGKKAQEMILLVQFIWEPSTKAVQKQLNCSINWWSGNKSVFR